MAKLIHLGLIGLLCLAGLLAVVAMLPLVLLILLGMLVFTLSGGRDPRELTRRVALQAGARRAV